MAKLDINYTWNFLYEESVKISHELVSLDAKSKELGRKSRKIHKLLDILPITNDSGYIIDHKTFQQIIDLVGPEAIKEID